VASYVSRVKTWISGEVLYAADLNAEFDNIVTNLIPEPASVVRGDILYRGASTWSRLAAGTSGQLLKTQGSGADPVWYTLTSYIAIPGSSAQGDVLYYNGTTWTRLGAGTSGQLLKTQGAGANPTWATITPTIVFAVPGTCTTGVKACRFTVPFACTISKAYAICQTGPTGADLIFDIHLNGTTIWTTTGNRVKIADGTYTGTQTSFDSTALVENDYLELYIDQVGSTAAGGDITVELKVTL